MATYSQHKLIHCQMSCLGIHTLKKYSLHQGICTLLFHYSFHHWLSLFYFKQKGKTELQWFRSRLLLVNFLSSLIQWYFSDLLFTTQSRLLTTLYMRPFENIVGKGQNAGNQHFLLFPQFFCPFQNKFQFLSHNYFCFCRSFEFGLI